jgi:hypothetical protein
MTAEPARIDYATIFPAGPTFDEWRTRRESRRSSSLCAQVPRIEAADLERIVERAADLCPVSNALRINVQMTVRS